jgi:hypothetical protein
MRVRRQTVEHPFGTIKSWMGSTHFVISGRRSAQARGPLCPYQQTSSPWWARPLNVPTGDISFTGHVRLLERNYPLRAEIA